MVAGGRARLPHPPARSSFHDSRVGGQEPRWPKDRSTGAHHSSNRGGSNPKLSPRGLPEPLAANTHLRPREGEGQNTGAMCKGQWPGCSGGRREGQRDRGTDRRGSGMAPNSSPRRVGVLGFGRLGESCAALTSCAPQTPGPQHVCGASMCASSKLPAAGPADMSYPEPVAFPTGPREPPPPWVCLPISATLWVSVPLSLFPHPGVPASSQFLPPTPPQDSPWSPTC